MTEQGTNPRIEIQACIDWLKEFGYAVPQSVYGALAREINANPHLRAADFRAVWTRARAGGFPMDYPVGLALSPVGGKEGNVSRVEAYARWRIDKEAKAKHEAEQAKLPKAEDPLVLMGRVSRVWPQLLLRLVKLYQGGKIPWVDFNTHTRTDRGFDAHGNASAEHIQDLRDYLAVVEA